MKRFLILVCAFCSFKASAQSAAEEAMILNQELEFLEDSLKSLETASVNSSALKRRQQALNEPSLEKTYFGEDNKEDVITTRSAVPKRRGL